MFVYLVFFRAYIVGPFTIEIVYQINVWVYRWCHVHSETPRLSGIGYAQIVNFNGK